MIRSHLVKALYQNLLGPRDGHEELVEEPFLKYEMGILNSSMAITDETASTNSTLDSEMDPNPTDIAEEALPSTLPNMDNEQNFDALRQDVDTDLSFKLGAVSLGLHFVLKGAEPRFKICATWARYIQDKQSGRSSRLFKRHPNFFVTDWLKTDVKQVTELENGKNGSVVTAPGVFLWVITRKIPGSDKWIIRIFLENRTRYEKSQREKDRIFQPQIRVVADKSSELLDLDTRRDQGSEYEAEDLLYMESRTKARGHMCAAVWNDVDPERDPGGEIGRLSWPDSKSVPKSIQDEFTHPLVRTEYLPLYAILQPDQDDQPKFDASELSDIWASGRMEQKLSPIAERYSDWIGFQRQKLEKMKIDKKLKSLGLQNLQTCDAARLRIRNGIDFLKTSERARAAFCFMNAVMNDKRSNEEGERLEWREFQMAFILQSLLGVSGESEEERNLADVLWFSTGGGKTEAYLGLVVFSIAYRRLTPGGEQNNDGGVSVISRYTLRLLTIQQFQRALGAIVSADIRRAENWLPNGALNGSEKILDPYMLKRFAEGALWGNHRFSIGMWIGSGTTPKDFLCRKVSKGKIKLNGEGSLLPWYSDKRHRVEKTSSNASPVQIHTCPVCKSTLSISESRGFTGTKKMTWIIKSPKSLEDLQAIPRNDFENRDVAIAEDPLFDPIGGAPDGVIFYRLTMSISPKLHRLKPEHVDRWWKYTVHRNLDPNPDGESFESTSPSMPGYFFLRIPGAERPHDFMIFCTNKECKLNMTEWHEKLEGKHDALVPNAFRTEKGGSRSVPISAYTVDEQIYTKCPSFLISTVDKFANLPFQPKCSALFGNVDVVHPILGYGRGTPYITPDPEQKNNAVRPKDLHKVAGFNPPSLILQDELHLIEGPLGSMVGVYEMAVDVLSDRGSKPKYIASSATIKETESQVGTIFRRGISVFPPSGINSSDTHFSKVNEDISCNEAKPGRLYLGMATTKSTVMLPIKTQSIIMSEIYKIKTSPEKYDLTMSEKEDLSGNIDPYWTFVSYFTDLQLLAKFTNYYTDDITGYVDNWSMERMFNSESRMFDIPLDTKLRLFPVVCDMDMRVFSISVYCVKDIGQIKLAVYKNGKPVGSPVYKCDWMVCTMGENAFRLPDDVPLDVRNGEKIWVGIINNSAKTAFQTVSSNEPFMEYCGKDNILEDFPDRFDEINPVNEDAIRISMNSKPRQLKHQNNIVLSSETSSEDLAENLVRLKNRSVVDSLQTSPVFGTGIDIDRLGIMEIMNQPKTNSSYIQSTGRVGRSNPGLVINWLGARRARDLNHYENFIGYHKTLHRFVEPVTASPFSYKAMELCLGPIMVSLLRNARSVSNVGINKDWIESDGPLMMSKHYDDRDVEAVTESLKKIASSGFIAEFRRMHPNVFESIIKKSKNLWRHLPDDIQDSAELLYDERDPKKRPTHNVVLGSPNHKHLGLKFAYENTPNSLRQTESTSMFYKSEESTPIRPSQFTTRYGPGSLISGTSNTLVVPEIQVLICNIKHAGNFDDVNFGDRGIYKYEVSDVRMRQILHRLQRKVDPEKIKMFSLPSNSSLELKDYEDLYECRYLSEWGICHNDKHSSKILAKTCDIGKHRVIKCPECKRLTRDPYSTKFYGVRYFVACRTGHLGDIDWRGEVHHQKKAAHCKGDVFEWKISGSSDDIEIICKGHWNDDVFVPSKCKSSVTYIELKGRSQSGQMNCCAKFAEMDDYDSKGCPRIDGKSQAKMINKTQMSLRMPIIATTMSIQPYSGTLFDYYKPIMSEIVTCTTLIPSFTKESFIKFLESQKTDKIKKITSALIRQTKDAQDDNFYEVIEKIKAAAKIKDPESVSLTEIQAQRDELESLENQTRDRGTGPQIRPDDPPPDTRFPIKFLVRGMNFEAMPFDKIKVTKVQTGYTREITPPDQTSKSQNEEREDAIRTGKGVRFSAKFRDNENVWYVANQLEGEGVFLHLDPLMHADGKDVFKNAKSYSLKKWEEIHRDVVRRNKLLKKDIQKKKEDDSEQKIDSLDMEMVSTNPLFVWWHSLVHELINQLAIDSGFMGVSLGERVYCIKKPNGRYAGGIFIYAASPGADGTLGGLTSLVNKKVLSKIVEKALDRIDSCSNDPLCSDKKINNKKRTGAACHACLMNSETSCSYQNRFLDRNIIAEVLRA